jgi:hypothetical protein
MTATFTPAGGFALSFSVTGSAAGGEESPARPGPAAVALGELVADVAGEFVPDVAARLAVLDELLPHAAAARAAVITSPVTPSPIGLIVLTLLWVYLRSPDGLVAAGPPATQGAASLVETGSPPRARTATAYGCRAASSPA